jgi:hypothetical protein
VDGQPRSRGIGGREVVLAVKTQDHQVSATQIPSLLLSHGTRNNVDKCCVVIKFNIVESILSGNRRNNCIGRGGTIHERLTTPHSLHAVNLIPCLFARAKLTMLEISQIHV